MRDNRGINRIAAVLKGGADSSTSSLNLCRKSTPIDASVLKERNTNETNDTIKILHIMSAAESEKSKDMPTSVDSKLTTNVQCASDNDIKQSIASDEKKMEITLDIADDDDDDDAEATATKKVTKSAKVISDDIESDKIDAVAVKVETNVHKKTNSDVEKASTSVANESVDSNAKSDSVEKNTVMVNGIDKIDDELTGERNKTAINVDDERSSAHTVAANKSNKRKISISSEDEQPPPAKR